MAVSEIVRILYPTALVGIVTSLVLSASCQATAGYPQVSLSYRAQSPVERVPGAENIKVNVMVSSDNVACD